MKRAIQIALILSALLIACGVRKQSPHEAMLQEVRDLIDRNRIDPHLPDSGMHIPPDASSGSWSLIAGIWIEDRLYYEALGIPIGKRPDGDDVKDRMPGIPASVVSGCGRCKRSWKWVEGHSTEYTTERGTFPLCERCWRELKTPGARLPYYRSLFDSNTADLAKFEDGKRLLQGRDHEWELIEAAVMAGK